MEMHADPSEIVSTSETE